MHIPDGLMWPAVLAVGWIISLAVLALSVRKASSAVPPERVPLLALLAAGIFVAQMLNFPIGGGTTGHLVGAALATAVLGFSPAILVITSVLIVQALLFGDGGITAFGLNVLNMGIIGCVTAYLVLSRASGRLRKPAIFLASWLAVFLGALACSIELGASYSLSNGAFGIPIQIALPAMLAYHALIGIGEGALTLGILAYLSHVLPEEFGHAVPARG